MLMSVFVSCCRHCADRLNTELYRRDPQYGQLAQLQRVTGLRREEAVHLQARCIAEDRSMVTLDGTGTHAEGGRERKIPIREQDRDFMQALRAQGLAHKDGHVFVQGRRLVARAKGATHVTQPASGSASRIEAHTVSARLGRLNIMPTCATRICLNKRCDAWYRKGWGITGSTC